nr:hypothetical protein [Rhodospirillales bacterium]
MSSKSQSTPGAFRVRAGQLEFERGVERYRVAGLLARRQYGKTTIAARIALKKMMKTAGHTVIFGSVKVDLGREIVRKESGEMQAAFALMAAQAESAKLKLDCVDSLKGDGKNLVLSADDYAELYEAQRLEFRLYHSKTIYSRTKVVALTPDAVGETGDLIMDEVGRCKKFRDVLEAVMPIIASNPLFRAIYTTTPPPDDTHESFDLLAPPIGAELPINARGNWYRSELGVWVLRVTAEDAYADSVCLYDDETGKPISPAESRRRAHDKDAWDRNYGCKFVIGGSSAIGLLELDTAQRRGIGQCQLFQISDDVDFDAALAWLRSNLGKGPVTAGVDWASSQKEGSNPTSVTVTEADGDNEIQRAVFLWKSSNPMLQRERLRRVVTTINERKEGGRIRRVGQDATGQQLFCKDVARDLAHLAPVGNIVMSETVELPGYDTPVTKKTYYSDLYVAKFNDNRISAPPERYYREDHRLPKKIKGLYVCEPQADGKHGDTFDSGKIASAMLKSSAGAITA